MISKEHDALMSLLAAVIIADKRVFAQEIEAYVEATLKLQNTLKLGPKLSEAKILLWYETNKANVKGKVAGPDFTAWLYECLDSLALVKGRQAILNGMNEIALADGVMHDDERALMTIAATRWAAIRPSSAGG
ncbi:TerB family tellurite resistance protein [Hellea sp.]|nr:TerB family tellurite resistance protein [Hellea sp.]